VADSRRIRAGVVGCGDKGVHGYLPHVSKIFDLVATCDVIEDRAREAARIFGAREFYADMDDMLARADVEAVFIVTSLSTHAPLGMKAVQAGKHYLIQKPFAIGMEDGLALVKATRAAGVKAIAEDCCEQRADLVKAKQILEEGHIGDVHYALGRTERGWIPLWGGENFYEREGGGMLFDMGVHLICPLVYLLGPAEQVIGSAMVSAPHRPPKLADDVFTDYLRSRGRGGDDPPFRRWGPGTLPAVTEAYDNTFTILRWPNNCQASVVANSVSFVLPPLGAWLSLCGDKGTMAFRMEGSGSRLAVATVDKNSEYHVPSEGRPGEGAAGWCHISSDVLGPRRTDEAVTQYFHDCIMNDVEPLSSVEYGCHVAEIMIKSFESSEKGQALDLETTF
jgi:predicted dehydrogenase